MTQPSNGSISPSGTVTVPTGGSQKFTITASTGYQVSNLTVDGGSVSAANTYTFSNVTGNHTFSAVMAVQTFTLAVTQPANGTISPSGTLTVNYGASQLFNFSAATGYNLNATVDGITLGSVSSYTLNNIMANHAITASTTAQSFTITVTQSLHGSISPVGPVSVPYNNSQAFLFTPDTNYDVASYSIDGGSAVGLASGTSTYTYTFNNVTGAHGITGTFTKHNYAPVAVADSYTVNNNMTSVISAPGVLANDTDANGDTLSAVQDVGVSHGSLTLNADGSFSYTPVSGYTGSDSFSYHANDGSLSSSSVSVTITVNQSPQPGLPSSYYGEIHYVTNPPNVGEYVQAYVSGNSQPVATAAIQNNAGTLVYTIDVPPDVSGTSMVEGGHGGGDGDVQDQRASGGDACLARKHERAGEHPSAGCGAWFVQWERGECGQL